MAATLWDSNGNWKSRLILTLNGKLVYKGGIFHCQGLTTLEGKTEKRALVFLFIASRRFTVPEELFGPLSLHALEEDPGIPRVGNGFVDIGTILPGNHVFFAQKS